MNQPTDKPRRKQSAYPAQTRRGYLQMEALLGLLIIGILLGLLATLATRQNAALGKLSETRAAVREAEVAFAQLQAGQAMNNPRVKVILLPDPPPVKNPDDNGVGRLVWVRVEVPVLGKSLKPVGSPIRLVGLVPNSAISGFKEVPHVAEH